MSRLRGSHRRFEGDAALAVDPFDDRTDFGRRHRPATARPRAQRGCAWLPSWLARRTRVSRLLPGLADLPVDELGLRQRVHALERAVPGDEVACPGRPRRSPRPPCVMSLTGMPPYRYLDMRDDLVVGDQLPQIEGDSHLEHPGSVDRADPCQHRRESGDRLLVPGLTITRLGIRLVASRPRRQVVVPGHAGRAGLKQRQLGGARRWPSPRMSKLSVEVP